MNLRLFIDKYKDISLIGMCKNAGKTTVLNHLINGSNKCLGLTSIGLDGESIDLVTKTKKPKIYIKKGDLVATAFKCLELSTITKQILMSTGINTPLGEVVIVKALSDGYIQLAGASISSMIEKTKESLLLLGAEKIIVDGALNRKSVLSDNVILCSGSAYNIDMQTVIEDTMNIARLFCLPPFNGEENAHIIEGALTDTKLKALIPDNNKTVIVVEDASKILLNPSNLKIALNRFIVKVKKQNKLLAIAINPNSPYNYSFDKKEFLTKMQEKSPVKVYNVMEE